MKMFFPIFFLTCIPALAQVSSPQEYELLRKKITTSHCYENKVTFRGCLAALDAMAFEKSGVNVIPLNFHWKALSKIYDLQKHELKREGVLIYQKNSYRSQTGVINKKFKMSILNNHRELDEARDKIFKAIEKVDFEKSLDAIFENLGHDERASISLIGLTHHEAEASQDGHASYLSATLPIGDRSQEAEQIGIGIQYTSELSGLRVKDVLSGSASYEAGLKAGDLIVKINDKTPYDSQGVKNFSQLLFGEEGSEVQLDFYRGERWLSKKLIRKSYQVNLSESSKTEYQGHRFGVIKLRTFDYLGACQDVKEAVNQFIADGVEGLILDLRNNGGGHENQARCIAGIFLKEYQVLYRFYNPIDRSSTDMTPSNPDPVLMSGDEHSLPYDISGRSPIVVEMSKRRFPIDLPLIVMVNSGSASASEMLAAGLRDNLRAHIVGERTFGKGCGQKSEQISGSGIFLMSTKYYFLRPSGSSVQHRGLTPDFVVNGSEALRENELVPHSLPAFGIVKVSRFSNEKDLHRCVDGNITITDPDQQMDKGMKVLSCIVKSK